MTTGLLLTLPFSDRKAADDAEVFALAIERGQRELLWRDELRKTNHSFVEKSILESIPARDAGDVCHVCGQLVTWYEHLPPSDPDGAVRCFVNVRSLPTDVVIDDIFPRV